MWQRQNLEIPLCPPKKGLIGAELNIGGLAGPFEIKGLVPSQQTL